MNAFPGCDVEEVNPYNLKRIGFQVYSYFALKNHSSLEAYYRSILTATDITDISGFRTRYGATKSFSGVLNEMRRALEIIEFEPNKIVTLHKLEESGVTASMLREFSQNVYDFVQDETFFTIRSICNSGFESDLFELGFSDWFYSNILFADTRFTSCRMFDTIVFFKGKNEVSIPAFITELVNYHGSIDMYDLINELSSRYGCSAERYKILQKISETAIYFDRILDRLYKNEELYVRELEEEGGLS